MPSLGTLMAVCHEYYIQHNLPTACHAWHVVPHYKNRYIIFNLPTCQKVYARGWAVMKKKPATVIVKSFAELEAEEAIEAERQKTLHPSAAPAQAPTHHSPAARRAAHRRSHSSSRKVRAARHVSTFWITPALLLAYRNDESRGLLRRHVGPQLLIHLHHPTKERFVIGYAS